MLWLYFKELLPRSLTKITKVVPCEKQQQQTKQKKHFSKNLLLKGAKNRFTIKMFLKKYKKEDAKSSK